MPRWPHRARPRLVANQHPSAEPSIREPGVSSRLRKPHRSELRLGWGKDSRAQPDITDVCEIPCYPRITVNGMCMPLGHRQTVSNMEARSAAYYAKVK